VPVSVLLLDAAGGQVVATNPAGRRRLTGTSGLRLSRWLTGLATSAGGRDLTTVHPWTTFDGGLSGGALTLYAVVTPIEFRGRRCVLIVLREDAPLSDQPAQPDRPAHPMASGRPGTAAAATGWGVFTLDAVGRIDSWGLTAQRLTGYRAEHVIGTDATLLYPPPARIAGEPHHDLSHAYRTGEHRSEGWRLCSDGGPIWAEVTTAPLYDGTDRLLGFATVMQDLTPVRRLRQHEASIGEPVAGRSAVPAPRPSAHLAVGRTRRSQRVPAQRRP
jgi:PAS domain S-box-containing protein